MPYAVDSNDVSTVGVQSAPVAPRSPIRGRTRPATSRTSTTTSSRWSRRANAKDAIDWVHRILKEERDIVISSRSLEATAFRVENIRIAYVFYESGLSINAMYTIDDPKKRSLGFKLSEGMEVPRSSPRGSNSRPSSQLAGTIRGSYFAFENDH